MRRTYISPEYTNFNIVGTFSDEQLNNFFSSNILNLEDIVDINDNDIVWYQTNSNEQYDISIESSYSPYIYSLSDDKNNNSKLIKENKLNSKNIIWKININSKEILSNYLFAVLKKERTFEGVKNSMTISNNVDNYIRSYIKKNIINKYKYVNIEFFIEYKSIGVSNNNIHKNNWDNRINRGFLFNDYKTILKNNIDIELLFNQKDANKYSFNYFYNIKFKKI